MIELCAGDKYLAACGKRSKVGMGVAGDPAYGNESRTGLMLNSSKDTVDKLIAAVDAGLALSGQNF